MAVTPSGERRSLGFFCPSGNPTVRILRALSTRLNSSRFFWNVFMYQLWPEGESSPKIDLVYNDMWNFYYHSSWQWGIHIRNIHWCNLAIFQKRRVLYYFLFENYVPLDPRTHMSSSLVQKLRGTSRLSLGDECDAGHFAQQRSTRDRSTWRQSSGSWTFTFFCIVL